MNVFIPGQRWISNTESELGLGLILETEFNRVTVLYLASGERRLYAADNAPLTRVKFAPGDEIESTDNVVFTVQSVEEHDGLLTYLGKDAHGKLLRLEEMELNHHIQFNKPQDRLFTGQFDPTAWFQLRYETWRRQRQLQLSPVKGLQGARIALIAHQLYIAHEAAKRVEPRVMLADEVGLGKTIEAGLILHHRLFNNLSQRILIMVPDSLVHQWLVEMLRRFNLRFSIIDEPRCEATSEANPFTGEQRVLCAQGFLAEHAHRRQQVLEAGWDIVVVDEAHHLAWSEQVASPEYLFVEQLAKSVPGLVLLTATPEQLGKESHFARLRLLDPDRYYSLAAFLQDEKQFAPVAEIAGLLLAGEALNAHQIDTLSQLLRHERVDTLLTQLNESEPARAEVINLLLDHHGTGRSLFRNSRQTVSGFPERQRFAYPLQGNPSPGDLTQDPCFIWLLQKLKTLGDEKVLLICHSAATVLKLEQTLKNRHAIASAVFHEGMTLVERDRAAAYFADEESRARLLICSEIGSEGRNFQFLHHLILFDLPENPDLLQQRIGRLDRIGQQHIIQLHIPYLEGSRQQTLYRWYDEGLNAFRHNSAGATQVQKMLGDRFQTALDSGAASVIDAFIQQTRELNAQVEAQLHHGRDQLLELNSCRAEAAQQLIEQVNAREQSASLWPYMEALFDCYGVDVEFHSSDCHILRPSENLRIAHFPMLQDDGLTVTVSRDIALAREDMQFLTDEHPMVSAGMDLVLSSETGNAAVSVIRHPQLKAGQFLLELLFVAECSAPPRLQTGRFLPPTPIRVLIDQQKNEVSSSISHQSMVESGDKFDKQQIARFLNNQREPILDMIAVAEQDAQTQMQTLMAQAAKTLQDSMTGEIKRLVNLRKINPAIRQQEIDQLQEMMSLALENIQATRLKLDAIRFVITA